MRVAAVAACPWDRWSPRQIPQSRSRPRSCCAAADGHGRVVLITPCPGHWSVPLRAAACCTTCVPGCRGCLRGRHPARGQQPGQRKRRQRHDLLPGVHRLPPCLTFSTRRWRAAPVTNMCRTCRDRSASIPAGRSPDSSCPSGGLPACPVLCHGGGRPPLTSAAVPVTLPSRVMVASASAWPSTYRLKKASVTRAVRRSTGFVPWYGIRWPAPNRSR